MNTLLENLLDFEPVFGLLQIEGAAYLFVVLIILISAKLLHDWITPYKLNQELTEHDNKAVAVAFSGYIFGVGIILIGIFNTPSSMEGQISSRMDFYMDLLDTLIWGIIGVILLHVARFVNDKILLSKFDNVKELVTDRNVGTGAAMWGSYVGSALIIHASILGESASFFEGLVGTLIYFVLGQVGFILFGLIYQLVSRYDLHAEIEQDNISAGVAFGLSLTAIAILLSGYVVRYDSMLGFGLWFIFSLFFLIVSRYVVDKVMLPGALLDEEISQDQNWGAALVEGGVALAIAFLLVPAFLN
jgi:uncharacterized membrane protein YjfL (UPF0719 family)